MHLILWLAVALFAQETPLTLDRVAATVDRDVITLSDLNQAVALRLVARLPAENEDDYRRRTLEDLVTHILRFRDLQRFGAPEISTAEEEGALETLKGRFDSPEEFSTVIARAELSIEDVRGLLRTRLQVQTYIRERLSPLVFVSLDEIQTHYRETFLPERARRGLAPVPFESVREEIREALRAERLGEEINRWTSQLKSRANVDVYVYR